MSRDQFLTAVIYDKRGRVLSIGQNSYIKTHTLQAHHAKKVGQPERIYLHAEIASIVRCKNLSKAHKIVITRLSETGQELLAKPCPVCMSAIQAAGIGIIQHT